MHNAGGALYLICYPQLLCWFTLVHIHSCVIQRLHYSIAVLMDDLRSDRQSNFFFKKWLSYTILQTAKCWVTVSVTCGHCLISMFKAWTLHGSSARYKHISMLHVHLFKTGLSIPTAHWDQPKKRCNIVCFIFRPFVLVNMRLKNKITEEGLLLLRKEQSTQCWQSSLNGFYFYPFLKDIALAHAIPTRLSVRSWKSKLSCPPCHASAGQLTDGCLWNLCSPKVYWGLSMAGVIPATVKEKIKHWRDLYSKREMDKVVGAVEDIYSW